MGVEGDEEVRLRGARPVRDVEAGEHRADRLDPALESRDLRLPPVEVDGLAEGAGAGDDQLAPARLVDQAREAAGAGVHGESVEGSVEARGRRGEDGGGRRASRGEAQGRRGEGGEAGGDEVEDRLLALEDQLAGQGVAVDAAGLADGPARREQEADDVLARGAGRVEERHGRRSGRRGRPPPRPACARSRAVSTSVSAQRRRRDAFSSRFASSVPFQAWSPSIAQLHSALSLGSPCRRGERVAPGERGERLGRQHLALRLARGAGEGGERDRPGLPGVAEVAAHRGQRAARLRRVDRAAEAGERRVDETGRRRLLRVPVPDRRREPLDLPALCAPRSPWVPRARTSRNG